MFNIGDTIEYEDYLVGERKMGNIVEVSSDMDSYEDMMLKDGVPYYASKKITAKRNKERKEKGKAPLVDSVYVPVKEKNMDSVFLVVETPIKKIEYILLKDIICRN